jgi:hypothetical protein
VDRYLRGEVLDLLNVSLNAGGEVSGEGTDGFDKPYIELVSCAMVD